jgi:hypothetical protein
MKDRGRIDRKKHEVDITERVLEGGVWAGPGQIEDARTVTLNAGVRVWALGELASAVRVQTGRKDRGKR